MPVATALLNDDLKKGQTSLLGEHSKREPPDPIPNSEVKPLSADDSVAVCHVKVGHRQALKSKALSTKVLRAFFMLDDWASGVFAACGCWLP